MSQCFLPRFATIKPPHHSSPSSTLLVVVSQSLLVCSFLLFLLCFLLFSSLLVVSHFFLFCSFSLLVPTWEKSVEKKAPAPPLEHYVNCVSQKFCKKSKAENEGKENSLARSESAEEEVLHEESNTERTDRADESWIVGIDGGEHALKENKPQTLRSNCIDNDLGSRMEIKEQRMTPVKDYVLKHGLKEQRRACSCMEGKEEWKETLAYKLYEERCIEERGEVVMDMLWEAFEVLERQKSKKRRDASRRYAVYDNNDYDGEQEDEPQVCCLKTLRRSSSWKINFKRQKSGLGKISKALKKFSKLNL